LSDDYREPFSVSTMLDWKATGSKAMIEVRMHRRVVTGAQRDDVVEARAHRQADLQQQPRDLHGAAGQSFPVG
jgi:hypothetical protein